MSNSDMISIAGSIVTLVAMAVSIRQAASAFKHRQAAEIAVAKVRLAANAERLKSAQEHIRSLPQEKADLRGRKSQGLVGRVRQEFDSVLGSLPKSGRGGEARKLLASAQASLNVYEASLTAEPDRDAWQSLQILVQDAISELSTAAVEPGDKS